MRATSLIIATVAALVVVVLTFTVTQALTHDQAVIVTIAVLVAAGTGYILGRLS